MQYLNIMPNTPILITFGLEEGPGKKSMYSNPTLDYYRMHCYQMALLTAAHSECHSLGFDWFPAMTKPQLISLWPVVVTFEFHSVHILYNCLSNIVSNNLKYMPVTAISLWLWWFCENISLHSPLQEEPMPKKWKIKEIITKSPSQVGAVKWLRKETPHWK